MKQNDFLDIVKFLLACFVLAIHAGLSFRIGCVDLVWPWVRLAVPLFFVISSYIFFSRLQLTQDKFGVLMGLARRTVVLYGFWFFILLPITLYIRRGNWFGHGLWINLFNFLKSLFLGSTFISSWFLTALLIAIIIIFIMTQICPTWLIVLISTIPFVWAVVSSSYGIQGFLLGIIPYNSFPVAILWVAIGKYFSEDRDFFKMSVWGISVCLILSFILLFAEWYWRSNAVGCYKCDCYFSLVPTSVFAFALIKKVMVKCVFAKHLRSLSVIIFVMHGSILVFIPARILGQNQICRFFVAFVVCFFSYSFILKLKDKKYFGWLKYSY